MTPNGIEFGWRAVCLSRHMDNRKPIAEMFGEFLREAAVLTVVFIPLDRAMIREALTLGWVVAILGISGGLLTAGMTLERKRKQ